MASFYETGYQLCSFPWQPFAADDVKIGLCEENRILIKNLHGFKGYRAKRLMKNFRQ